jgi:lipooligosaccharide transport system permease protein
MAVAVAGPGVGAWSVVEHELIDARRYWSTVLVEALLSPLLYVLALGVGLGTVVNAHSDTLGVTYVVFVAPAFLTAAALQNAASSATFGIVAGFKWVRYYHGMAATPLTSRQICDGKLAWIALRTLAGALIYFAIMACFGAVTRGWAVLAIPAAVLTAMAFAAPLAALSAAIEGESQAFNVVRRFVVTPMFLFSGTFYPVGQLPGWGRWLAYVSPLWHGTQLARGASIGHPGALAILGHVGYLAVWLIAGLALARWRFRVRLEK